MSKAALTERYVDPTSREAGDTVFRSMVEFAPCYFYQASADVADTFYISPQAETMLGYGLDEWKSDPNLWLKAIHPEDRERVAAEFAAGISGKKPLRSLYRIATSTPGVGSVFTIRLRRA